MQAYRLLTEDDTSAFCHKVTEALSKGWTLMRCGQAVTKMVEGDYDPDVKLGQL